jgi:DNA-binding ferritin-like protein
MSNYFKIIILSGSLLLSGCQSAYYATMEKVGVHKRDILVSRVDSANESQQEAQQQFRSILAQLSLLIDFDGGDLSTQYEAMAQQYEESAEIAEEVSARINAIGNVAGALFEEWQDEIEQFTNAKLKRQSQQKLRETQFRYKTLIRSMRKVEDRMQPVLAALKDNTLYLKHNLNEKAIGALQGEYKSIKQDIEKLVVEMNRAIKQSQKFINALEVS